MIKDLINKYYKELKTQNLNKEVNVPDEMKISDIENGWSEWKIGKPFLDQKEVEKIFKKYNLNIPNDYKEYLTCCQFFDIEKEGYKIFGINKRDSIERLISYTPKQLLQKGYLVIGDYEDYDYVVLNTKTREVEIFDYDNLNKKKSLNISFKDFLLNLINNK
jgi:hypothetical protein